MPHGIGTAGGGRRLGIDYLDLELTSYPVRQLAWGSATRWDDGRLTVDRTAVLAAAADPRLGGLELDLALPGEPVRVIHVVDAIEPRAKLGGGCVFPGFLGPPETAGWGRTLRLEGVVLLLCAEYDDPLFLEGPASVNGPREKIVDMSGPGQRWSPFGGTLNLVLSGRPASGVPMAEYDRALRQAALKLAEAVARGAAGRGGRAERIHLAPPASRLPRVVYVKQIEADGYLRDTFLYGETANEHDPLWLSPNELLDGAVVSGNCDLGSVLTISHCGARPVDSLCRRHGSEVDFAGVILTTRHMGTDTLKARRAAMVAKLARFLDADGAVLTQEGAGNSIVDQMLQARCLERAGVRTAVITYEMDGTDGRDFPLIHHVPEADLLVSLGNREELVELPAMERSLGGERYLFAGRQPATSPASVHLMDLAGSIDLGGYWRASARGY